MSAFYSQGPFHQSARLSSKKEEKKNRKEVCTTIKVSSTLPWLEENNFGTLPRVSQSLVCTAIRRKQPSHCNHGPIPWPAKNNYVNVMREEMRNSAATINEHTKWHHHQLGAEKKSRHHSGGKLLVTLSSQPHSKPICSK